MHLQRHVLLMSRLGAKSGRPPDAAAANVNFAPPPPPHPIRAPGALGRGDLMGGGPGGGGGQSSHTGQYLKSVGH